jgi:putative salt-induced outer membrane protein YdiY
MSLGFNRIAIVIAVLAIGGNCPAETSGSGESRDYLLDVLYETPNDLEFEQLLLSAPVGENLPEARLSLPPLLAQVQTDGAASTGGKRDAESAAKSLWTGNVEGGIQIREGNTETFDIYGKVGALRKSYRRELSLKASYDFAERDDDTERNRAFAASTYRRYRSAKSYIFGTINVEQDEIEELDFRLNAAVGPGYKWIDTEDTKLTGEAGFGVTAEWYDGEDQNTEAIVMIHGHWRQKVFDESIFGQELTVYPSISDFGSFRLVSITSLATPLSESLDLRVSLVNEYDNDPGVSGVEKNDLTFRTTVVYRF